MKKVLIGVAAGLATIYLIKKFSKSKSVEHALDDATILKIKAKKKLRNAIDHIHNQAEYLGDRLQDEKRKAKRKYSN